MPNILRKICYTEKFTALTSNCNQYVFEVDIASTKNEIATAIRTSFNVKVLAVNIIRRDGKVRRNKMRRGHFGRTAKRKIAIVTLKRDDKIEII
ncbi:MAG: 50S ribosomal protein L23 [Puniceicoccales bacterium]|jgi:large subunit ribosomal protein L23|nr:50S ribosomal protein L23 [Puniceicoccales bacterium]